MNFSMSIIKLVQTATQNRSPEIAHTKLPKWSLWDFIDVGKDRRLLALVNGPREKYLAEGL